MGIDGGEFGCSAGESVGDGGNVEGGAGELEGGGDGVIGGENTSAEGCEFEGFFDDDAVIGLD